VQANDIDNGVGRAFGLSFFFLVRGCVFSLEKWGFGHGATDGASGQRWLVGGRGLGIIQTYVHGETSQVNIDRHCILWLPSFLFSCVVCVESSRGWSKSDSTMSDTTGMKHVRPRARVVGQEVDSNKGYHSVHTC